MDAVKYFSTKKRMTNGCKGFCLKCCLSVDNNDKDLPCNKFEITYPEEAVEKVKKWGEEHIEITAEKFAEEMKYICTSKKGDPEALHIDADDLMKKVLIGLGYDEGIEELEKQNIWYA